MSKYIHLTLVLLIISGLSGLILGFTNEFTKEQIIQVKWDKINDNMNEWFPSVPLENKEVNAAPDHPDLDDKNIVDIYNAMDESDNLEGYILEVKAPDSYGGGMVLLVGIDIAEGKVVGFTYVNFNESGPGANVRSNESFINRIIGKDSVSDVDTVSGATYTSTATLNGVQIALDYFDKNLKE